MSFANKYYNIKLRDIFKLFIIFVFYLKIIIITTLTIPSQMLNLFLNKDIFANASRV